MCHLSKGLGEFTLSVTLTELLAANSYILRLIGQRMYRLLILLCVVQSIQTFILLLL